MYGEINEICNTEHFTWQKTEIPLDWTTASFIDDTASHNEGEAAKFSAVNANTLAVDTGSSTSTPNNSIAAATITAGEPVFTSPLERAVELSFKADLSSLPYNTSVQNKYGEFYFGLSLNKNDFFKDPAIINTNSSSYDAMSELVNEFSGAEHLFMFKVSPRLDSEGYRLEVLGSFYEKTGISGNYTKTQKNTGSPITSPLLPFDGEKTITLRLEVGLGNVLSLLILVDGELYQFYTSVCGVNISWLQNATLAPVFMNFYRGSSNTYQITDIKLDRCSLSESNNITNTTLTNKDFSSSRVKAILGKDLLASGALALESVSDGIELFKTFLTGEGYNGDGGCNWDLIFEDGTRIVVRAKAGNRNYFKLAFSEQRYQNSWLLLVKVTGYTLMSDIDSGEDPFTNPSTLTLSLPMHKRRTFSTSSSIDEYRSLSYQDLLREDFCIVASDKSLLIVSNISFCNSDGSHAAHGVSGGFGEYPSIIPDYQDAVFVYCSSYGSGPNYSHGVAPFHYPSSTLIETRGIEGDTANKIPQLKFLGISKEESKTFNSSLTGGPVLFPVSLGVTPAAPVGMLPGVKVPLNRYPSDRSALTVNLEFITDVPPCGSVFSANSGEYIWWFGGRGQSLSNPHFEHSFTTVAISLNDEDWP